MTDFDSYIRQGEPSQRERANNWSIAIGLQAVDGLTPSAYLIDSARENIEGRITLDEVRERINAYYQSKEGRELEAKEAGKEEADKVSENIARLLSEKTFALNVATFANIHRRIFAGVLKHAGEFRTYNISKREWVLDGESVIYAPYELLRESLEYDFEQERQFDYSTLSNEERLNHLMHFIAGIWQIHPFAEGNTRTTAVFAIFYFRKFGYIIDNEPFARYSLFFRNALVRANYENHSAGISATYEPLTHFFRYILLGEKQELRNRYLHIRAAEILPQSSGNDTQNVTVNVPDKLTERQRHIVRQLVDTGLPDVTVNVTVNATENATSLALKNKVSERTIKRDLSMLQKLGIIKREGSDKTGNWIVQMSFFRSI